MSDEVIKRETRTYVIYSEVPEKAKSALTQDQRDFADRMGVDPDLMTPDMFELPDPPTAATVTPYKFEQPTPEELHQMAVNLGVDPRFMDPERFDLTPKKRRQHEK